MGDSDWLEGLVSQAKAEIAGATAPSELEKCRITYLGRGSELTKRLRSIASLPASERKEAGARLNRAKSEIGKLVDERSAALAGTAERGEGIDVTAPGRTAPRGYGHPISLAFREVLEILRGLGFEAASGPEVETDYNNFEALNTPHDHPARDMQDSFYLTDGLVLRTQTSAVWVHVMKRKPPPIRIVCPGRCYRRDVADASHSPVFHQVEGLWVDDRCTFSDLKGILEAFLVSYFGEGTKVRFDPSYFPFTEPSAEVSVQCATCRGAGCQTCARSGWLELLGAGMVHPNILARAGGEYAKPGMRGFAFGVGVERLAMVKHRIPDMRSLYENDIRLLAQVRG